MDYPLFAANLLHQEMLNYSQYNSEDQLLKWNLNQNTNDFHLKKMHLKMLFAKWQPTA